MVEQWIKDCKKAIIELKGKPRQRKGGIMKETKFAKLLKETGISGSFIARKCGVSPQTVSKWVVGKSSPVNNKRMNMLAWAMNVPYNEVLACFFYEEKPKKWWKNKTEV